MVSVQLGLQKKGDMVAVGGQEAAWHVVTVTPRYRTWSTASSVMWCETRRVTDASLLRLQSRNTSRHMSRRCTTLSTYPILRSNCEKERHTTLLGSRTKNTSWIWRLEDFGVLGEVKKAVDESPEFLRNCKTVYISFFKVLMFLQLIRCSDSGHMQTEIAGWKRSCSLSKSYGITSTPHWLWLISYITLSFRHIFPHCFLFALSYLYVFLPPCTLRQQCSIMS